MSAEQDSPSYDVIIVGAGFGGIAMAYWLKRRGFKILEKGPSVGGTWRDNGYPGARCDVPSVLYSLSFAPKPDWSCNYPPQREIHAYLEDTARRLGIERRIRFNVEVTEVAFDKDKGLWQVK